MNEFEKFKKHLLSSQSQEKFLEKYCYIFEQLIKEIYVNCFWYKTYITPFSFKKSLDLKILELTDNLFNNLNDDFLKFIKNQYTKKEYNDDLGENIEIFDYYSYLNLLLFIMFSAVAYDVYSNQVLFSQYLKHNNDLDYRFNIFLKNLEYYSLKFDYDNYCIITTEHYELLETIESETLNSLVYNIKSSNTLEVKSTFMSKLAINIMHILENNDFHKILVGETNDMPFKKDFIKRLSREANGYFRHRIEDSGDKDCTKEWLLFNEQEKINIINKTLTYYLSILAIIKNNDDNFIFRIEY